MNQQIDLAARRADAERRLTKLRQRQGAAVLSGQTANVGAAITAVEQELAALDAAEQEQDRRATLQMKADGRASRDAALGRYRTARTRRAESVGAMQKPALALGASIREALAAVDEERAAHSALSQAARPGVNDASADLAKQNFEARLWSYLRGVFREALRGATHFGPAIIAGSPGDPLPNADWAKAEARFADLTAYHQRSVPE